MEKLVDTIESFIKKYPEYLEVFDEKQLRDVCTSPFLFVKEHMDKGDFESVRIKHVGLFKVYKGSMRTALKKKFHRGLITEKEYEQLLKSVENA